MRRNILILASVATMLLLAGCGGKKESGTPQETVRGVPVVQIQRAPIPDAVEAVGSVRANQTAQLSAEIVATVRSVQAAEGKRVRRGEVLIVLDDAQQRAGAAQASAGVVAARQQAAAAEANYGLAQATLNRYQTMYEKKSVSPHEMDEVRARYQSAAAQREAAQAGQAQAVAGQAQAGALLSYTRIRAPFDGVVTAKGVDRGALAAPGVPLLTVEDTSRFRLEATVDESDLRFVSLGGKVPVSIDALGDELAGTVQQIVPAADPASRSFTVKVELPRDPRLHSGLFGRARFPRGQRDAVMVPRAAVLDRGQLQGVYVVGADRLIGLRFVTLGQTLGDQVEVLSGLSGGERVIAAPGGRELVGRKLGE
jgi:RND family efflux transporter MFP subunit